MSEELKMHKAIRDLYTTYFWNDKIAARYGKWSSSIYLRKSKNALKAMLPYFIDKEQCRDLVNMLDTRIPDRK